MNTSPNLGSDLNGTSAIRPDLQSLWHRLTEYRAYEKWKAKGCPNGTADQDWLEAEGELRRIAAEVPKPVCPYQVKGPLLTGEEGVICTLGEGSCPMQTLVPTTGGRHTALCALPIGMFRNRGKGTVPLHGNSIGGYTAVAGTAGG